MNLKIKAHYKRIIMGCLETELGMWKGKEDFEMRETEGRRKGKVKRIKTVYVCVLCDDCVCCA